MEHTEVANSITESAQADPQPKLDSKKPAGFLTHTARALGVNPASSDYELAELLLRLPSRNVELTYIAGKGWRHAFTRPVSEWYVIDLIAEVSGYENDRPRTIEKIAREISLARQEKIASAVWRINNVIPGDGVHLWLVSSPDPGAESHIDYLISVPYAIIGAEICGCINPLLDFDDPAYADTLPPRDLEIWRENLSNVDGTAHLQRLRKMAFDAGRTAESVGITHKATDIESLADMYRKLLVGLRVQIVAGRLVAARDETESANVEANAAQEVRSVSV